MNEKAFLLPDEKVLFRTRKHVIIFIFPIIVTILAIYFSFYMQANPYLIKLFWAPWLIALIFWAQASLEYITSHFIVTNKRLLMREGFFTRHANEIRLATVSQVSIDQSLVGQLFDYGKVSIHAFGAFDAYPLIAKPFIFQKSVNEQLDKIAK